MHQHFLICFFLVSSKILLEYIRLFHFYSYSKNQSEEDNESLLSWSFISKFGFYQNFSCFKIMPGPLVVDPSMTRLAVLLTDY